MILATNCTGDKPSVSSDTLWQFQTHREEIAPAHWVDKEVQYEGKATLALQVLIFLNFNHLMHKVINNRFGSNDPLIIIGDQSSSGTVRLLSP